MSRHFLAIAIAFSAAICHCGQAWGDEFIIANRPAQQSLSSFSLDNQGNLERSKQITAGELWQFFNDQGVTSVDQLTLNLNCDGQAFDHSASIRFQIQDPSGNILTNLSINPNTNRLEVPLDFDYMQRFSKGSKELIRLDLSDLDDSTGQATITVDSESSILGPFNVALVFGFFAFWVVVFFMLNRFTKPIDQGHPEDILVQSLMLDLEPLPEDSEAFDSGKVSSASLFPPVNQANAGTARSGASKMVSAQ